MWKRSSISPKAWRCLQGCRAPPSGPGENSCCNYPGRHADGHQGLYGSRSRTGLHAGPSAVPASRADVASRRGGLWTVDIFSPTGGVTDRTGAGRAALPLGPKPARPCAVAEAPFCAGGKLVLSRRAGLSPGRCGAQHHAVRCRAARFPASPERWVPRSRVLSMRAGLCGAWAIRTRPWSAPTTG